MITFIRSGHSYVENWTVTIRFPWINYITNVKIFRKKKSEYLEQNKEHQQILRQKVKEDMTEEEYRGLLTFVNGMESSPKNYFLIRFVKRGRAPISGRDKANK